METPARAATSSMVAFATGLTSKLIFIAFVSAQGWLPTLDYLPIFNQPNMSQPDHKINIAQVIVNREQTM